MRKSKLLIVFLSLFLSANLSIGQTYIGFSGGLNMAKLFGNAPAKAYYKKVPGLNVGAFIDVRLTKGMYLSFQPSFSQEGTKISYALSGETDPVDSIKIRLNYFALPVSLKISSTNERFYAIAGFETSMLLSSSVSIDDQKEEIKADVTQWNFAMHFGAGIHIPLGFSRMFVEARFVQGLVDVTDDQFNNNVIPRVKTSSLRIMTGIEIPLTKPEN